MIIPGGWWRGVSASQVWKLPAGAPGSPVAHADHELLHLGAKPADGESVPERGPGLSPGERGAKPRGSWVSSPRLQSRSVPSAVAGDAAHPTTPWLRGFGSSSDDAGMPCCVPVPAPPSRREPLPSRKPPAPLRHGAGPFPLPTAEWLIPPLSGGLITGKIEALFPRPSRRAN